LAQTLVSYKESGLLDIALETMVFLQENNPAEIALTKKYGLTPVYSSTNVGIQEAYREMCARAHGEYFLFLENDWECVEDNETTALRLRNAIELLKTGVASCVRLRHKYVFGDPLSTRYQGREADYPAGWINCIHWIEDPSLHFPDVFKKIMYGGEIIFLLAPCHATFGNSPGMYKTDFIRKAAENDYTPQLAKISNSMHDYAAGKRVPVDKVAFEEIIRSWWAEQPITVAMGTGLFAHHDKSRKLSLKRIGKRIERGVKRICRGEHKSKNLIPQIAFISAHRDDPEPSSLIREFAERGWKTRIFHDAAELRHLIREERYFPDIIFHLGSVGFWSKFFAKFDMPDIYMAFASADDHSEFAANRVDAILEKFNAWKVSGWPVFFQLNKGWRFLVKWRHRK
jgi:hypothetical protein